MIVVHSPVGENQGLVNWRVGITGSFISRNGTAAQRIEYDPSNPMAIIHEVGHLLDCRFIDIGAVNRALMRTRWAPSKADCLHLIRSEIRAWRIAKSICLPEYWNEAEALGEHALGSYIRWVNLHGHIKIDRNKLRIVPLNRGVKIGITAGSCWRRL